jgi:hypothetical protein
MTLAARIGIDVQKVKRLESGIGAVSTLLVIMSALDFDLTGVGPEFTADDPAKFGQMSGCWSGTG